MSPIMDRRPDNKDTIFHRVSCFSRDALSVQQQLRFWRWRNLLSIRKSPAIEVMHSPNVPIQLSEENQSTVRPKGTRWVVYTGRNERYFLYYVPKFFGQCVGYSYCYGWYYTERVLAVIVCDGVQYDGHQCGQYFHGVVAVLITKGIGSRYRIQW